jgi:hypothetical protein
MSVRECARCLQIPKHKEDDQGGRDDKRGHEPKRLAEARPTQSVQPGSHGPRSIGTLFVADDIVRRRLRIFPDQIGIR